MAKRREGVDERILECAKREFLAAGFPAASLRRIAQEAGTSTGSIYTRFGDKDGLFDALVCPAIQGLEEWFIQAQEEFASLPPQKQRESVYTYGAKPFAQFMDYVYDHLDAFRLVLCCSQGTRHRDFIDSLVRLDMDFTGRYMQAAGLAPLKEGGPSPVLWHMLSSAFYTGIFEAVVHGLSRGEAQDYMRQLRRFFARGWSTILEPETEQAAIPGCGIPPSKKEEKDNA